MEDDNEDTWGNILRIIFFFLLCIFQQALEPPIVAHEHIPDSQSHTISTPDIVSSSPPMFGGLWYWQISFSWVLTFIAFCAWLGFLEGFFVKPQKGLLILWKCSRESSWSFAEGNSIFLPFTFAINCIFSICRLKKRGSNWPIKILSCRLHF